MRAGDARRRAARSGSRQAAATAWRPRSGSATRTTVTSPSASSASASEAARPTSRAAAPAATASAEEAVAVGPLAGQGHEQRCPARRAASPPRRRGSGDPRRGAARPPVAATRSSARSRGIAGDGLGIVHRPPGRGHTARVSHGCAHGADRRARRRSEPDRQAGRASSWRRSRSAGTARTTRPGSPGRPAGSRSAGPRSIGRRRRAPGRSGPTNPTNEKLKTSVRKRPVFESQIWAVPVLPPTR